MRVENLKKQESVVESVLFTMGQSVEIRWNRMRRRPSRPWSA